MTKLLRLAEAIWQNTVEIEFGNEEVWNINSFKRNWFLESGFENIWTSQAAGWYWFMCEIDYNQLQELNKPITLPAKGCNFGEVSCQNMATFSEDILCQPNDEELVIYNGHEGVVTRRIRAHF